MGPFGPISVPALLDQLEALDRSASGGRSGGMSLPINVEAIDLMRCMEAEAREYMADLAPAFRGSLKEIILFWATEDISGEDMVFYEHVTLDWCDQIEALLMPKKPRRKLPRACPACNVLLYGEEGEDRTYALSGWFWDDDENMVHPSQWDVSCAVCGAQWKGDELAWLRSAFEAGDTPREVNDNHVS
jgi:hypothetical protein